MIRLRHGTMLLCLLAAYAAAAQSPPGPGTAGTPADGAAAPAPEAGLGQLKMTTQSGKALKPSLDDAAVEAPAPAAPVDEPARPAPSPAPEPAGPLLEAEWSEALYRANEAYATNRYAVAAVLYERLVQSGLRNGHLYYNLGNSLVRSGRLGRGIAAYLGAARLLPRDGDVQANLGYARQNAKDAIDPVEPSALLHTLFFWHYGLSTREALLLAGLISVLFWAGLIVRMFRRESEALRWAVVGLFMLLLASGGSLAVRVLWPTEVAVVVGPEIKVRSGTARDATVLFELHEGAEVELLGEEPGWLKIQLADGKRGWLKAEGLERVRN